MKKPNPDFTVDFVGGPVGHRRKFGGGRGQSLPKAVGMKNTTDLEIVDATAGLGRDAFLLASLGAKVTLIERSAQMAQLLQQGLDRARQHSEETAIIVSRMTLIHADAMDLLPELKPAIVLIDPMHPERKNAALVKQELRNIRRIVGADDDASELLATALKYAQERVVLKWPQKASPLANASKPSHQILGKTTRYDVFMIFKNARNNSEQKAANV